ncbi:MAG: hypothetical protein RMY30_036790 [Nostoc sp. CmiSLP01]|nr:hypothetical protein [Nostoc sp. CmiSLP01]MDZ8286039.1 hypothetical protein [Nostoc sp. ChiSLP01]
MPNSDQIKFDQILIFDAQYAKIGVKFLRAKSDDLSEFQVGAVVEGLDND